MSDSKRIVFTTWGSFGDIHPFMGLALEMQARGHRPAIATLSIYREKIEAAGLDFYPLRPDTPSYDNEEPGDSSTGYSAGRTDDGTDWGWLGLLGLTGLLGLIPKRRRVDADYRATDTATRATAR